jgi:hypothetical protein
VKHSLSSHQLLFCPKTTSVSGDTTRCL